MIHRGSLAESYPYCNNTPYQLSHIQLHTSYHIFTYGLYEKKSGMEQPTQIESQQELALVFLFLLDEWKNNRQTPLLCVHINDGGSTGAQSTYLMKLLATMNISQLSAAINIPINGMSKVVVRCRTGGENNDNSPTIILQS